MRRTLTLLALAALAVPAHAAPQRHFLVDPVGDARVPSAGFDVVSADVRTSFLRVHGRKVPKDLVVTVTLAGAVPTVPGASVLVTSSVSDCEGEGGGFLELSWSSAVQPSPGAEISNCHFDSSGVDSGQEIDAPPVVRGSTITWTVPLTGSRDLAAGTYLDGFRVYTDLNDPVLGEAGTAVGTFYTEQVDPTVHTSIDQGTSDGSFIIG